MIVETKDVACCCTRCGYTGGLRLFMSFPRSLISIRFPPAPILVLVEGLLQVLSGPRPHAVRNGEPVPGFGFWYDQLRPRSGLRCRPRSFQVLRDDRSDPAAPAQETALFSYRLPTSPRSRAVQEIHGFTRGPRPTGVSMWLQRTAKPAALLYLRRREACPGLPVNPCLAFVDAHAGHALAETTARVP